LKSAFGVFTGGTAGVIEEDELRTTEELELPDLDEEEVTLDEEEEVVVVLDEEDTDTTEEEVAVALDEEDTSLFSVLELLKPVFGSEPPDREDELSGTCIASSDEEEAISEIVDELSGTTVTNRSDEEEGSAGTLGTEEDETSPIIGGCDCS